MADIDIICEDAPETREDAADASKELEGQVGGFATRADAHAAGADAPTTHDNDPVQHRHANAHAASTGDRNGSVAHDGMPDEELLYDLADLFKVFGDTTRIKILYALMERDRCVAEIAELIGATQSAVSHQLRSLRQARLVKFQRDGKNVIYSLSDDHVYTMLAQGMTHICE